MPAARRDRKREEAIKYGRQLLEHKGGSFTTDDWKAYRHKLSLESAVELVSVATVYRWYKDSKSPWTAFLAACQAHRARRERANKCSEQELIGHVQTAAKLHLDETGRAELSTHSYDNVRASHPDLGLRSSSAIRKHLGPWPVACARAGVQSPDQKGPRRFTPAECIAALKRAKAGTGGMLTMQSYAEFVVELSESGLAEDMPDLGALVDEFGSWEAALHFADVEQSTAVHPQSLWEASEAREIARRCELLLRRHYGREFDREGYELLCSKIRRPMPPFEHLMWLLQQ